jgi:hypothetical protein
MVCNYYAALGVSPAGHAETTYIAFFRRLAGETPALPVTAIGLVPETFLLKKQRSHVLLSRIEYFIRDNPCALIRANEPMPTV